MTSREDVWTEVDEDSPYTTDSLARLAMSAEARELADSARGHVPTRGRRTTAGDVQDAAGLVVHAEMVLQWAVIAAREAGESWEDIGLALGIKRQSAHERYADAVRRWREDLVHPYGVDDDGRRAALLHDAAHDPDYWAPRLDEWARRHLDPGDVDYGERPVSAGLRRMGPLDELLALGTRRTALLAEHLAPPPAEVAAICEREAVLYERLADAGLDVTVNREAAARARARAEQLRAEATTATTPEGE
jgi:hypothetical protein